MGVGRGVRDTAEPVVSYPRPTELEIPTANLKVINCIGSDQILADLIQVGGETWSEFHEFINFISNKEEMPDRWKKTFSVQIHKKGDKTVVKFVGYRCHQLDKNFTQYPSLKVKSIYR
jgi:hypothetical protein